MKFPGGLKPWRVRASEINGEYSRLIEFLVWARTEKSAARQAVAELKQEWGMRDREIPSWLRDSDGQTDIVASFEGGSIVIKDVSVDATTVGDILRDHTRAGMTRPLIDVLAEIK